MIGITVSSVTFKHELEHYFDNNSLLNNYKPLAKEYQVDLCIFSFRHIKQNTKMVEALVYSCKQDNLIQKIIPVPGVNIARNTSYVLNQELINKFEILRNQGIHFINFPLYWQANKLQNYEYLNSLDKLKNHVPPTKGLSFKNLKSFIRQYGKVIIKPVYGTKGRGITIIEKDQFEYQVYQTSLKNNARINSGLNLNQKRFSFPHSEIKQFYNETFRKPASFLVQEWIPFKEFNGCPFDIRAVMQKNGKNKWQLTSRVARVAKEKGYITNLNQGGEMVSLSELSVKKYHRDIRRFCLEIAKALEKHYPWTAEMGVDLAIGKDGKLWYIETNFCSEKIRWATIFKIPFEYAYYLYTKK